MPLYKDPAESAKPVGESRAYQWLRRTIDLLAEGDNPEDFLEHTKLELFHDQVFCFTPKGRLIALPRGATPIDFAYAVHTDVGNTAVRLQDQRPHGPAASPSFANGDEVDIVRAGRQPGAAGGLGKPRRHRQGARRHPPAPPAAAVRKQYAGLGLQIL